MSTPLPQTIAQHFEGKGKEVRATYDRIMAIAREWGDVKPEAKKTSIHLLRTATSFAGIATRKDALILTLKSETTSAARACASTSRPRRAAGTSKSS
jgi:hypothetical protein